MPRELPSHPSGWRSWCGVLAGAGHSPRPCRSQGAENPRLGSLRCVDHATKAIAECIVSGKCPNAESNMGLLGLVSGTATANRDAPFTVERVAHSRKMLRKAPGGRASLTRCGKLGFSEGPASGHCRLPGCFPTHFRLMASDFRIVFAHTWALMITNLVRLQVDLPFRRSLWPQRLDAWPRQRGDSTLESKQPPPSSPAT